MGLGLARKTGIGLGVEEAVANYPMTGAESGVKRVVAAFCGSKDPFQGF